MTAGQWPVYQVFERPAPNKPLRAGGSVHAVDAETALENAWAVYGRRPTGVSLCVVPRAEILSKTREEFANITMTPQTAASDDKTYSVFRRSGAKLIYEEAKPVVAGSAEQAMALAIAAASDCFAIWVFPSSATTSSADVPADCPCTPQSHKWFRDHKSFPVLAMLREIRADEMGADHA
jgi:ring-1,2-phenylacetyl-CoA epoxidase subunit PaaB